MRHYLPCVGLVVFLGCFSFVIVPDFDRPAAPREKELPAPDALSTVVIDPGHGGNDEGTKFYGLAEKDLTLDVAQRLEKTLRSFNFPTMLTRRDDRYVPLGARVGMANKIQHSVFVSIHFNSSSAGSVGGVETFFADQKSPLNEDWTWVGFFSRGDDVQVHLDNGEELAGFIEASLVTRMDAGNRGIHSKGLYVVRHTRAPAVLVEAGFLSNPLENQLLRNEEYRQRLANAIAEGIMTYEKSQHAAPPPDKLATSLAEPPKRKD